MNIAEDALVYRVERTKEATPANAPILYQYGAFGRRLGKEESVDQLFKNRRATVSLGYIGCTKWLLSSLEIAGKAILKPRNSHWKSFAI